MEVKLEKTKSITIKEDQFVLDIANLTVKNLLIIESEKQRLSRNEYANIATTYFPDSQNAASLIDMIAIFRVLLPEIEKGLSDILFEELNIVDVKELLGIYVKEVAPWYRSWMKEFNSPFEDDEVEDDKE